MSLKRKQMHLRQKDYFEQKLKERLSVLSGKGVETRQTDKDPIVKKLKADIKAVNYRLARIAASEKITEDMVKLRAERAAALLKEKEGGKAEKPKKGPEEPKEKKPKPEKKPGAPKAPAPKAGEGGQGQPQAGAPQEGKAPAKKKEEGAKPAEDVKPKPE